MFEADNMLELISKMLSCKNFEVFESSTNESIIARKSGKLGNIHICFEIEIREESGGLYKLRIIKYSQLPKDKLEGKILVDTLYLSREYFLARIEKEVAKMSIELL